MIEPAGRSPGADILYNPLRPEFAQNPYPALHRSAGSGHMRRPAAGPV